MLGDYLETSARRVVAGIDEDGKSMVVSDQPTPARLATDAFVINQIWRMDSLPPRILADDASGEQVSICPPAAGFIYLVTTFPPDSSWDLAHGYEAALAASGDREASVSSSTIAGLHETDTVDIITVISGEMYAVLEHGEVLLKKGDSFVQRGTKHAWSNRTNEPCTIVAVMAAAVR